MPERFATVLMPAALRCREHERTVLDCTRAVEHMPMRLACLFGECGRHGKERGPGMGQCTIERRKPDVITDGQAKPPPRQVCRHSNLARAVRSRFAVALAAREIDIEHVYFVVAGDNVSLPINQKRPIYCFFRQKLDGERADMKKYAQPAGKLAKSGES